MARPWWDSEGQSRTEDGGLAERETGPAQRGGDRRCRPQSVVCGACLSVVRLFPRRPGRCRATRAGSLDLGRVALTAHPSPATPPLAEKRHLREPTRPSRADALGPSTEPGLRQARREGAAGAGGDASGLPGLLLARRQAGGHRAPSPLPSRPAGSGRSSSTLRGQSQSARGKRPAVVRALVSPLVPAQRWQQV